MISAEQGRRLVAMGFLLAVAFACLGLRLFELQVLEHDDLRSESEEATHKIFLRAPKRGDIRDIRGNVLAGSIFVKTVSGNPAVLGSYRAAVAQAIAPLLEMPESDVLRRLEPRVYTNKMGALATNKYVVVKRKVPVERWQQIHAVMQQFPPGVDIRNLPRRQKEAVVLVRRFGIRADSFDDQERVYPNQSLAAHVLGFVGGGHGTSPNGRVDEVDGLEGVELALNKALKGVVGWRSTEVALNRELVAFRDQNIEAHPGRNVILTLDLGVQHILESELAEAMAKHTPISACGVVVRPRTGEILAMANLPSYNPNDRTGTPMAHLRNRVIADIAEPGSTFKIVVVAGALNDGVVTLDDSFDCENGVFHFAGRLLHDHERYGVLTVEEIITKSSNIGAAKIGIRLGSARLYDYMRGFGFGAKSGIPLPGEVGGLVYPVPRWTKLSISRIPMGHEVAVTPLQMMMAMSAVANRGRLMRPMLVDRLEDAEGQVIFKNGPQQVRQVVSERAASMMVQALKTVVATNGTGRKAMLEHYTVAGKTGTAQKIVGGKYRRDKHFSSFLGFFPADDAEVCIGIFLDEPKHGYYGGEAAAPVFREVAERVGQYLAIPADQPPAVPESDGVVFGGNGPVPISWGEE
jgi:cell division protein FtsI/penicillin-binding protein 2